MDLEIVQIPGSSYHPCGLPPLPATSTNPALICVPNNAELRTPVKPCLTLSAAKTGAPRLKPAAGAPGKRAAPAGNLRRLAGTYLGQRWFRHKSSKRSFRVPFWLIVALYQVVALDALLGWPLLSRVRL
jgi:hypothetical protein